MLVKNSAPRGPLLVKINTRANAIATKSIDGARLYQRPKLAIADVTFW